MIDSIKVLRGLEEMYPENGFITRLLYCIETHPDLNWGDAMSRGQITSKMWLLNQLRLENRVNLGCVVICGGWVGMLARLMLDHDTIVTLHVESIDIDHSATQAARDLNYDHHAEFDFDAYVSDCYEVNYGNYDTIINTSCEHFEDFDGWFNRVPDGRMVILQSNNFTEIEDHVDCVHSANELVNKAGLRTVIYSGELPCYGYTRYMVIGVK
jgi:hypothetical protein